MLAVACSDDGTDGPGAATWRVIEEGAPSAMLAVWGTSTSDVWTVGSRATTAGGPALLRYDGTAWAQVDSGQASLDLWWVFGFAGGDVFFGGSGGTILRYRNGTFEKMPTPRLVGTVFGIWGASPTDVWAVGTANTAGAIVWRYDGNQWTEVTPPAGTPSTVFKVHGRAANDVWMAAANGVTLHWDGVALTNVPAPAAMSGPLFSIITTADRVIAGGGNPAQGVAIENDGSGWVRQNLTIPSRWRGVAAGDNDVFLVGESGVVGHNANGGGWKLLAGAPTQLNFHAAWVDPDGGMWGVGGVFDDMFRDGFILYYGKDAVAEVMP